MSQGEDEVTWSGLSRRERVLVAVGLSGVGLVAAGAVGVLLLLAVLGTVAVFPGVIEIDGPAAVFWAVLLVLPCELLATVVVFPMRYALRNAVAGSPAADRVTRHGLGWFRTFLTAGLVLACTPGLHCHSLWPALCVATFDALVAALLHRRA
ncbi:hypothetical protein [Streptomyces sp. NPDC046197]|uniref:hypothetical protein n=1 Tax=Streptomyces sp. NPDC046197 TaxID=3154337 RepID=UPI0033D3C095